MGAIAEMIRRSSHYTDRSPCMTAVFPKRSTINLEGRLRGLSIACESGKAWVTQLGDARDYVLLPGWDFCAGSDEQVVVQILEEARITFRFGEKDPCDLRMSVTSGHYSCEIRPIPVWKLLLQALRRNCGLPIRAASPDIR